MAAAGRPRRAASARSTSSRTAATPTTASPPSRRRPPRFMQRAVRRHARPGDRGQPLHRLEAGPRHAAGLLHQPRRRHADDRARLPRRRHAHRATTAARSTSCRCWPRTASSPTSTASPPTSRKRAKLLVHQLPEQPDRRSRRRREFYERVIDFAQTQPDRHRAGRGPHPAQLRRRAATASCRSTGAKDVGVEVHSMSKGFNMIGWRIGWVCGHPKIVQAFADVKDNSDSGQFMAIQQAAAAALDDPRFPSACATKYQRRLREAGRDARAGAASTARCRAARTSSTRRRRRARRAADVRERRGGVSQYLIHEQSICMRAVGRRRAVPALLRHLRGRRTSARRTRSWPRPRSGLKAIRPVF